MPPKCQPVSKSLLHINSFTPHSNTSAVVATIIIPIVQMRRPRPRAVNNMPKPNSSCRAKSQAQATGCTRNPRAHGSQTWHPLESLWEVLKTETGIHPLEMLILLVHVSSEHLCSQSCPGDADVQPGLTTALCCEAPTPPGQGRVGLERRDGNFQVSLVEDDTRTSRDVGDESQPCRKAK